MDGVSGLFANKLKQAIVAARIKKYGVAKASKLSEAYVGRLEAGHNLPSSKAIEKLAPVIGVPEAVMQAWVDADRSGLGEEGLRHLLASRGIMERPDNGGPWGQEPGNHGHGMISARLNPETKSQPSIKDSEQVQRIPSLGDNLGEIPSAAPVRLPVFGIVSCGDPAWMPETALDFLDVHPALARDAEAAIIVRGSSMVGCGFFDGDYLYVRRLDGETPASGKTVVACVEGEYTCVIYRRDSFGEYLEKHPPGGEAQRYPIRGETRIHALVVAHTRYL